MRPTHGPTQLFPQHFSIPTNLLVELPSALDEPREPVGVDLDEGDSGWQRREVERLGRRVDDFKALRGRLAGGVRVRRRCHSRRVEVQLPKRRQAPSLFFRLGDDGLLESFGAEGARDALLIAVHAHRDFRRDGFAGVPVDDSNLQPPARVSGSNPPTPKRVTHLGFEARVAGYDGVSS